MMCLFYLGQGCSHTLEYKNKNEIVLMLDSDIKVSQEARNSLEKYLKLRTQILQNNISGLKFPNDFKNDFSLSEWLETRSPKYANRVLHCSFIQRLLKLPLEISDKARLEELTENGKICIAADLPESRRNSWSFEMVEFLYHARWIEKDSMLMTLIEYADKTLNIPTNYNRPTLYWWSHKDNDATYSARSEQDDIFLKNHENARSLFNITIQKDLHELSLKKMPTEKLKKFSEQSLGRFASIFMRERAIYFTNSFGAADIPGILLHEYGHIIANEMHLHLTQDSSSGKIVFQRQSIFDEACAETFDRVVTGKLYDKFPELEAEWIMKMILLSHLKPTDPHVLGNSLALEKWDFEKDQIEQLISLLRKGRF